MHANPATPEAGKPTKLSIVITEQSIDDPVIEFEIMHNKLLRLLFMVSGDFYYFDHLHPQLDNVDGIFTVAHTFPESGEYKIWADVEPRVGSQVLAAFRVKVTGQPSHMHLWNSFIQKILPRKQLTGNTKSV